MEITIKVFKEPIIFAGGAIVGAVIGGFYFKKKYERISNSEIEEAKAFYSQVTISNYLSKDDSIENDEEPVIDESVAKPDEKKEKNPKEIRKVDYTRYYSDSSDDSYDAEYEDGHRMTKEASEEKGVHYITAESYTYDYPQFPKEELFYYSKDDTLTNNAEELIDDQNQVIGDAIKYFNPDSEESETIYVRNFNLGCDYEITKINGSFW